MADRHQAPYIPFRCSRETSQRITELSKQKLCSKSELLRELVDKGLAATGAKVEEGEFYQLIQQAVSEALKPQIERLAAISAKATHISGAAFFMSIFAATRDCSQEEQRQIEEAAGTARELGIQYLKLKDRDMDAFLKEGAKRIIDESEDFNNGHEKKDYRGRTD